MALKLQPNQVHLWYLRSEEPGYTWLSQAIDSLISPAELTHSQNFLTRQARDSYLITRAFVRTVLSQYIDVSPQSWSFLANAYGKPEIATPSAGRSLRFSVANTDGLVTCAVALDRDIGVDAEVIDSTVETEEIADRFFARAEVSDLRALPPDERPYRFFEFWTLKESYIKARGLGLSLPLEKFAFVVQRRRSIEVVFDPSIVDDQGLVEDPRNWHFSLLQPIKSHLIAVALGRLQTEARVSWREAIELTINPLKQFAYGAVPFSSSWDSPTDATGRPSPMVTRSRTPLGCDVTARGAME